MNQQKTQQTDDKLVQTQALTLQRYSTYLKVNKKVLKNYEFSTIKVNTVNKKEFNLLQYALGSAQIFFRSDSTSE